MVVWMKLRHAQQPLMLCSVASIQSCITVQLLPCVLQHYIGQRLPAGSKDAHCSWLQAAIAVACIGMHCLTVCALLLSQCAAHLLHSVQCSTVPTHTAANNNQVIVVLGSCLGNH